MYFCILFINKKKEKSMKITKQLILLVLFVSVATIMKAQYDIKIDIKNYKEDTLLLGYYYLGDTYAIDTSVSQKGHFEFKKKDKKLEDGIYFFTNNKGRLCEFVLSSGRDLSFSTNDEDWANNMKVKGNKEEDVYFKYIQASNAYTKQFKQLSKDKNTLTKEEYNKRLVDIRAGADSVKNSFIKDHPEDLLTKILKCSKPIDIPEFPTKYKQDGSVDSLKMQMDRFVYYKQHYFDNVDFSCSGLIRTPKPVFFNNYKGYWDNVMKYESNDSIFYYANIIIDRAKKSNIMYKYIIDDVTTRYLQDGIMGHDEIYVNMIDKYFKSGIATWLSPSDVEMNVNRANKWRNLLVGKTIPDLACPEKDTTTTWHHLNEIKAKYKVLIFWSVECGHCTEEMPKIAIFYNDNKQKYDMEVFALHTEGDIKQRDEFVKKYNLNWINVNGSFANYDWREYFDIEKTPIIYILDKNNKIIAKNISAANIEQVLDVLEKGGFKL